jgi:hypothetical protein
VFPTRETYRFAVLGAEVQSFRTPQSKDAVIPTIPEQVCKIQRCYIFRRKFCPRVRHPNNPMQQSETTVLEHSTETVTDAPENKTIVEPTETASPSRGDVLSSAVRRPYRIAL